MLEGVAAAQFAVDSLLVSRKRAEQERGLDAMPLRELDMWVTDIQVALIAAQRAASTWQTTATDIRNDAR